MEFLYILVLANLVNFNHSRMPFKKLRDLVLFLRKQNIFIATLDLGGGIGIVYNDKKDKIFKISEYAKLIEKYFSDLGLEIILEPGRFLVGASGILISKVIRNKKEKKGFPNNRCWNEQSYKTIFV